MDNRQDLRSWAWQNNDLTFQWYQDTKKTAQVVGRQRATEGQRLEINFSKQFLQLLKLPLQYQELTIQIQNARDTVMKFSNLENIDGTGLPELVLEMENTPVEMEISRFSRSIFHLQSQASVNRFRERQNRDLSESIFSKSLYWKLFFFGSLVVVYSAKIFYTKGLFKQS